MDRLPLPELNVTWCLRLCHDRTLDNGLSVLTRSPQSHDAWKTFAPPPGAQSQPHQDAQDGGHQGDEHH